MSYVIVYYSILYYNAVSYCMILSYYTISYYIIQYPAADKGKRIRCEDLTIISPTIISFLSEIMVGEIIVKPPYRQCSHRRHRFSYALIRLKSMRVFFRRGVDRQVGLSIYLSLSLSLYIYIYIERERDVFLSHSLSLSLSLYYTYIYIHIHVYIMCIYIYIYIQTRRAL